MTKDLFYSIIKSKKFIWSLCSLSLWAVLIQMFFLDPRTAPFWSRSLAICGYSALASLVLSLSFAPLSRHFPIPFFLQLNRFKKQVGLAAFYYAVIHVLSYFVKSWLKKGAWPWVYLVHPVIIPGEIALVILLLLAVTSLKRAKKWMGWEKWKRLHRWVYVAEGAVFLHLVLQRGAPRIWGLIVFPILLLIQRYRRKSNSAN